MEEKQIEQDFRKHNRDRIGLPNLAPDSAQHSSLLHPTSDHSLSKTPYDRFSCAVLYLSALKVLSASYFNKSPSVSTMSSLAASIFLSNTILYFILEAYTAAANTPSYSYTRHFTSALSYPYPYRDRDTNIPTHSPKAYVMKANFIINGLLTLVGQFAYIDDNLTVARKFLAVVYCVGISLVSYRIEAKKAFSRM